VDGAALLIEGSAVDRKRNDKACTDTAVMKALLLLCLKLVCRPWTRSLSRPLYENHAVDLRTGLRSVILYNLRFTGSAEATGAHSWQQGTTAAAAWRPTSLAAMQLRGAGIDIRCDMSLFKLKLSPNAAWPSYPTRSPVLLFRQPVRAEL
jgi:hypothetical protein